MLTIQHLAALRRCKGCVSGMAREQEFPTLLTTLGDCAIKSDQDLARMCKKELTMATEALRDRGFDVKQATTEQEVLAAVKHGMRKVIIYTDGEIKIVDLTLSVNEIEFFVGDNYSQTYQIAMDWLYKA